MRFKKIVAILQIALQILPTTLISTSYTAHAESPVKQTSTEKNKDPDSTLAQVAVQTGTLLSSDDAGNALGSALVSAATGTASSSIQQWLSQFGTAKVSIGTDEYFSLQESSLDLLLPLYDGKENILFTQLGGRHHDDRNIINGGFGYRHLSDKWMLGGNIFYDYQISSNHHRRLGIGTELGWDFIKLSANGYFRLSNWMSSKEYTDFDERVANGFDIRATGYLPAYPQLGANLVYEQYYGDHVGLFGNDEDDRQKNPHAVTLGLNYTPVPLVTLGVNQKFGKSGKNETEANLAVTWSPGVPLSIQLDPDQITFRRSLQGGRHELVDRNNNIVLDYRKQTLITLSLPSTVEGSENARQAVTGKVTSKYGLERIDWQAENFYHHGGKITTTNDPQTVMLTLPAWQSSGLNSYTIIGTAWDTKGNASKTSQTRVVVNGFDVTALQSTTTVAPTKIAADGQSTATVTVTLKTANGDIASGFANRLSAVLSSTDSAPVQSNTETRPTITAFNEASAGVYVATITSGTTPDTLQIQPLLDGTIKLQTARLIEEAAVIIPQLAELDASTDSVIADNTTLITLNAHVSDQYGSSIKDQTISWSADKTQAVLSASSTTTDEQGNASITVSSADIISTIVTAQLAGGNSQSSPTLHFTADNSSAKVISINSDKQEVVANNNDTSSITAQVTDSYSHPLENITVNWKVEKTDDTLIGEKTSVTDAQGIATLTLKSAKTGVVEVSADVHGSDVMETDEIQFVADSASQKVSSITLSKTQATANGSDNIVYEATVTDTQGNIMPQAKVTWNIDRSTVTLNASQTETDSNGKTTVTASSLKAGDVIVSASSGNSISLNADKASFIADTTTAKVDTLTSDRTAALANGNDAITLTATVSDANDNLVSGAVVSWQSTPSTATLTSGASRTGNDGVATVAMTSNRVEHYSVSASSGSSSQMLNDLQYTADSSTAQVASISADKISDIVADKDKVTLTALVVDANQHPISGITVNWSSPESSSSFSAASSVSDSNGQAMTVFNSLKSGNISTTASVGSTQQTQPLQFIGNTDTAQVAKVTPNVTQQAADGNSPIIWTARIVDANDNPLQGLNVAWSVDNANISLTPASTSSDETGAASVSGTTTITGNAIVTAAISSPAGQKSAASVTFIGDVNTAHLVSLKASTDHIAAGSGSVTYTTIVQDAHDNPVANVAIDWTTTLNTLSASTTNTNNDGVATVLLSGAEFGKATVTAKLNDSMLSNNSVSFMGVIEADWNPGGESSTYKGVEITAFPSMGFLATGNTTGPTSLQWSDSGGTDYSVITLPMTNEAGETFTITLRGQRVTKCALHQMNSAVSCQVPSNTPKLIYNASENTTLPAGVYRGNVTFDGKDWRSSWALSYSIRTTLTVN